MPGMERLRLPFTVSEIYGGFARVDGLLVVAEKHLEFEYQTSDNVLGAVRGKIQKRKVRYADLESVKSKLGWFSCWIEFHARSLKTFANFPQKDRTAFRITVEKKHRTKMNSALSEIELQRSYIEADRLIRKTSKPRRSRKKAEDKESPVQTQKLVRPTRQ